MSEKIDMSHAKKETSKKKDSSDNNIEENKKEKLEKKADLKQEKKKSSKIVKITQDEYDKLLSSQKLMEEAKDKMLRIQADFDNTRKRILKEKEEFCQFANEQLLIEILPVIDNFDRALAHTPSEVDKNFITGVEMIRTQLLDCLKKSGVDRLDSVGKPFNPESHHAIAMVESKEFEKDIVCEEVLPGYKLNDKLLRPATVKVSNGTKAEE